MILHESAEMYLETIHVLSQQQDVVHAVDIARHMGFSKPTISEWMVKLVDAGYVNNDDGHISLTDAGLEVATKVYARHLVLEDVLKKIGVSDDVAEEDACRIEHYISDETFNAFKKLAASLPEASS
ncbi:MAG: metal-dependent transcriptional regulator [Eggerthellaceae bacterium]|nr:metal-dependent transcriptional regulator [Eggerthellaceae bacterium]